MSAYRIDVAAITATATAFTASGARVPVAMIFSPGLEQPRDILSHSLHLFPHPEDLVLNLKMWCVWRDAEKIKVERFT